MSSQPTESTGMLEFAAWLDVNKRRIGIALAAVVVVGFGYWVYQQHRTGLETDASNALTQIALKSDRRAGGPGPGSADYLKVAGEYPGTAAAERAQLLTAGALFTEGKYSDAKAKFDAFAAQYPDSSLASVAAYGSAASIDGMNDLDKAMTAYKAVSVNYPNEPAGTQAKLAMAAIFESKNQPDEAIKIYNDIAPLSDDAAQRAQASAFSRDAGQRRELLFEKYPAFSPKASINLPGMPGLKIDPKNLKQMPKAGSKTEAAPAVAPAAPAAKK